eukprot:gene1621-biopygen11018
MNSCHEEGALDRNRAGIEATDPAQILLTIPIPRRLVPFHVARDRQLSIPARDM